MDDLSSKQFLFIVGAPRSGTTWLFEMLSEHPSVVSLKKELTLFSSYLAAPAKRFEDEVQRYEKHNWRQGLSLLYDRADFERGMRSIVNDVYSRVLDLKPQATHILDKHPGYAQHLLLMDRLVPNCRFIHIIRDGREVAVSMMRAKRTMNFGAGEVKGAATDWATHVRAAMQAGKKLGADRYHEVRYEDLMSGTTEHLEEIFRFAGLPVEHEQVNAIASENQASKKLVSRGDPSLKALRNVPGGIWKNKLALEERYLLDRYVGDLLCELGYAEQGWWALSILDRVRMSVYPLRVKAGESLRALLRIWSSPIAGPPRR
ncbi:MAG: sulfotransferase [Flavobacteriales bacterium]|nr:sulfotransferase [Flavobacteriales bacterium]MCC6937009.1 sulfotransferase [Flavobacteriales bacterium]